jgi:hypothetical protein
MAEVSIDSDSDKGRGGEAAMEMEAVETSVNGTYSDGDGKERE